MIDSKLPAPASIDAILNTSYPILEKSAPIDEAVKAILENKFSIVLVSDGEKELVGTVTKSDILRYFRNSDHESVPIEAVMAGNPLSVTKDALLLECLKLMQSKGVQHLPVVDDKKILGAISLIETQKTIIKHFEIYHDELEKMSSRLKQKDDYLAVVAHDVRSPLGVIDICCDYILSSSNSDDKKKLLTAEVHSFIERIQKNASKASKMVAEILDVTRLTQDSALHYESINAASFLNDIAVNAQLLATEKHLKIQVSAPKNLIVSMDLKRMSQALENLVGNAIKFSQENKNIYLKAEHFEDEGNNGWVRFSVRDEGFGIKEEDVGRIFTKYQQLDNTVVKNLGIGLGLSIANQFISIHKGYMEVDGGFGHGATFYAIIPGAIMEGGDSAAKSEKIATILFVEDDPDIQSFICSEFAEEKLEILVAGDGEQAISLFRRHHPDIIVSDIRMPKMDGFELLAAVRLEDPHIPFILCSGVYTNLTREMTQNIFKPDLILEKPYTPEELMAAISRFFDKER